MDQNGELFGDASYPFVHSPTTVPLTSITGIGAGAWSACASTSDEVYCWGNIAWDQAGPALPKGTCEYGFGPCSIVPTAIGIHAQIDQLAVGGTSACVLLHDKTLRCWGSNAMGELGHAPGTDGDEACPGDGGPGDMGWCSRTPSIVPLSDVARIDVGNEVACAITSDGAVWCWGFNGRGQLGVTPDLDYPNPYPPHPTPAKVVGVANATAISVSGSVCAITGGKLACWGSNSYGELGHSAGAAGDTNQCRDTWCNGSPSIVPGLDSVREVSATSSWTCALKEDGTVWCWGINAWDVLGHDPSLDVPCGEEDYYVCNVTPTPVVSISDAIQLSHGDGSTTCVVRKDQSIWCWGADLTSVGDMNFIPSQIPGVP